MKFIHDNAPKSGNEHGEGFLKLTKLKEFSLNLRTRLKQFIKAMPFYPMVARLRTRLEVRDVEQSLIYVHIGKCGGESLWNAIQRSPIISVEFKHVKRIHISKPPVLQKARYLIVIRNPIDRAISAFNWRYKLAVDDEAQANRFEGEYDILLEYKSLNALAEALYDEDGKLNSYTARQFRTIHHLKEDIAFYLTDLLPSLSPKQLFAVLATETLDQDITRLLDVDVVNKMHSHRDKTPNEKLELSDKAKSNLRLFLANDYDCVEKLLDLANISDARRQELLA